MKFLSEFNMRCTVPLMLVATTVTGGNFHANSAGGWADNLHSVAQENMKKTYPVKEPFSMITTPKSPLEIIKNCKLAFDSGALFKDEFYTEDNLKLFFGGRTVRLIFPASNKNTKEAWVRDFRDIVKPVVIPDIGDISMEINLSKYVANDGEKHGDLDFLIRSSHGDLKFDIIEQLFGKGWRPYVENGPISPAKIYQPVMDIHGNQTIQYTLRANKMDLVIFMKFNKEGCLSEAIFRSVEVQQ